MNCFKLTKENKKDVRGEPNRITFTLYLKRYTKARTRPHPKNIGCPWQGHITFYSRAVDPLEYLQVEFVWLEHELRSRGFGRLLYKKALEVAKEHGYKGLVSSPACRNPNSDRIWKDTPTIEGADRTFNVMT